LRIRALQAKTGGFTEFVPLPFVPMETPIYLKGRARRGPTWREAVLMHAVARLALHRQHPDLVGQDGQRRCRLLPRGRRQRSRRHPDEREHHPCGRCVHGQEMPPESMEEVIRGLGREPRQRTTLYGDAPPSAGPPPSPTPRSPSQSTPRPAAGSAIRRTPPPTDPALEKGGMRPAFPPHACCGNDLRVCSGPPRLPG